MKKTTIEEVSAGGLVFRKKLGDRGEQYEFLIGKHSGYHKWVLPKGLVERGEAKEETAVREVAEEVGVRAKIISLVPLKTVEYYYFAELGEVMGESATGEGSVRRVKMYQEEQKFGGASSKVRVHKRVFFYLMEMEEDLGGAGWEMEDRKWVSYEEAIETLAFESEWEVVRVGARELGMVA